MTIKLGLIIPASGGGERCLVDRPKQFLSVGEVPLFWHTILKFVDFKLENFLISSVFLVVPKAYLEEVKTFISMMNKREYFDIQVICGGQHRFDSVRLAFKQLVDVDYVLIHDGVRPFLSKSLLSRVVLAIRKGYGVVIPVCKVTDTLKEVCPDTGRVIKTVNRDVVVYVQTPQLFAYTSLKEAYDKYDAETSMYITDEAMLIESTGGEVYTVPGDRRNLKITYADDLSSLSKLREFRIR